MLRLMWLGAHCNPAFSLLFALRGILPWKKLPTYWLAQYLGAFAGSAVALGVYWGTFITFSRFSVHLYNIFLSTKMLSCTKLTETSTSPMTILDMQLFSQPIPLLTSPSGVVSSIRQIFSYNGLLKEIN